MNGVGAKMRVASRPVMALPPPDQVAKRVGAALAYAGIDIKDSQSQVGISAATMARIVSRTSPRGAKNEMELALVADACDVPMSFLLEGFQPEDPTVAERVEALERKVDLLLKRLGADDPPEMPGELRLPPGAQPPTADTDRDDETDQDSDAGSGRG